MKGSRVRVLLVDDHAVVRAGYRLLLQNAPEIEVVAEADSGELGCRLFAELAPDVVVMDLTLPGIGGLEALRRIVQRDPKAKVLVFSMHEDILFVEQALAAGARGYVTKSSAPQVLVAAVKQVAAGGQPLARDIGERLKFARSRGGDSPLQELSTREFEIFCLLAEGSSSAEIAKRLSLSHKTVANYGTQLKAKLGVATVAELTRLAIRHGVIAA
jgi:two-component system, NarL family, invasion response regulator UvrY